MTGPLRFRAAAALPGQAGLSVQEVDWRHRKPGEVLGGGYGRRGILRQ